jgi:replicative superfamily II helicase
VVDFKKLTKTRTEDKPTDPAKIYEKLDRKSDKGPLRPAQEAILRDWYAQRRGDRDLILKLHTGQGKTLIGLLICQSQINAGAGPALYLCANHQLVKQTCQQAEEFGIACCTADADLPDGFLDGKTILVTTVQKLFNGRTKFGLGTRSEKVGTVVMDDAHACIDSIREACTITIEKEQAAYTELRDLFAEELTLQGAGTFADLKGGSADAVLCIPYWAWHDRQAEVVAILAKYQERRSITFAWPLLKDRLAECCCVISGKRLEIVPQLPPLDEFGSFANAKARIFMSATVANDAFLVRSLGLTPRVIESPLVWPKEKWSGEKMVLVPSLIGSGLDRARLVKWFAQSEKKRAYGIVALVPSFGRGEEWEKAGAKLAHADSIDHVIETLKAGEFERTVVLANRYDGVDLPDKTCRILVLDSKPVSESLQERYVESSVEGGDVIASAVARKIEQGLGRSVRGEKDWSVIVLMGLDLVAAIRTREARRFLSAQTRRQVEIGLEIANEAKKDMASGDDGGKVFMSLISQCLRRDQGWKDYYESEMNAMDPAGPDRSALDVFTAEREAEQKFQAGNIDAAKAIAQKLANAASNPSVAGWYLQECARYEYARSKVESNRLQASAHKRNRRLLKPKTGMEFKRVQMIGQRRVENCREWIRRSDTPEELMVRVDEILDALRFGTTADTFEAAFDHLGAALGFATERPDKDWKEGPDNLWGLRDNDYLIFEAKSEVLPSREAIHKDEAEQMDESAAWFDRNYAGANVRRILIIPTRRLANSAAFSHDVAVLTAEGLEKFRKNVRSFFVEFLNVDLNDISDLRIQGLFAAHTLTVEDLMTKYAQKPWSPPTSRRK